MRRMAVLGIVALAIAACSGDDDDTSSPEAMRLVAVARDDLHGPFVAEFKVVAPTGTDNTIEGGVRALSDQTGTIESTGPEAFRSILSGDGASSRTIYFDGISYDSQDDGRTWLQFPRTDARIVQDTLDDVCSAESNGDGVTAYTRSRVHGCDEPLRVDLTFKDDHLHGLRQTVTTDFGDIRFAYTFDLTADVARVEAPDPATVHTHESVSPSANSGLDE